MCFGIVFLSSIRASNLNLRTGNFAKLTLSKYERNRDIFENYRRIKHWMCFGIAFSSSVRASNSNLRTINFEKFPMSKCEKR